MKRTITMLVVLGGTLGLSACAGGTDPATHIQSTQAQLNAHGRTDDGPAQWWWEYGTSPDTVQAGAGTKVCGDPPEADGKCGPGESAQDVQLSVTVKGLTPSTTYWYRACGQDAGEAPACGDMRAFTTTPGNSTVSIQNLLNGYKLLQFSAAPGTRNAIAVHEQTINGALHYVVSDGGFSEGATTVLAGAGCQRYRQETPTYDNKVQCPAAGIDNVRVLLGDRNDNAEMYYNTSATASLDGGSGDDQLYGTKNNDRLTGGTGFDLFSARGGSDRISARDGEIDSQFHCGELGADADVVEADRDDPVSASATNCETVDKPPRVMEP